MNIPSFTASMSLYQPKILYVGRSKIGSQEAKIVPTAMDSCIGKCAQICTTQSGNNEQCLADCQAQCKATAPVVQKNYG